VSFLQEFIFLSRHQLGNLNKERDVVSTGVALLCTMQDQVMRFDTVLELYSGDPSFK
jgi:hypothetical protein